MIPRPGTSPVPVVRMTDASSAGRAFPIHDAPQCPRPHALGPLFPNSGDSLAPSAEPQPPAAPRPSSLSPSSSSACVGGRGSLSICLPGPLSHDLCTSLPTPLLSSPTASPQVPFPLGGVRGGFCPFRPRAPTHSHPSCSWGCLRNSGCPGPGARVSNRWGGGSPASWDRGLRGDTRLGPRVVQRPLDSVSLGRTGV